MGVADGAEEERSDWNFAQTSEKADRTAIVDAPVLKAPNKTSTTAACVRSLQLRVLRLGFLQDGDVGVAAGRLYESRELQIKGVNFLRAHVAQHKRGIIRG